MKLTYVGGFFPFIVSSGTRASAFSLARAMKEYWKAKTIRMHGSSFGTPFDVSAPVRADRPETRVVPRSVGETNLSSGLGFGGTATVSWGNLVASGGLYYPYFASLFHEEIGQITFYGQVFNAGLTGSGYNTFTIETSEYWT